MGKAKQKENYQFLNTTMYWGERTSHKYARVKMWK